MGLPALYQCSFVAAQPYHVVAVGWYFFLCVRCLPVHAYILCYVSMLYQRVAIVSYVTSSNVLLLDQVTYVDEDLRISRGNR